MSTAYYLQQALLELVKSTPQKQRLIAAFSKYLVEIDGTDLPPSVRPDFINLCGELEAMSPLPGETAVQATVRKMSMAEAEACAARVVSLVGALLGDDALAPATARHLDGDTVIPLFAVEA